MQSNMRAPAFEKRHADVDWSELRICLAAPHHGDEAVTRLQF
jgi:hypothetical protein